MTDQQRYDALSCHGGWIKTPALDALASGGADLRQHFAQAPVCVPSRTTLFTGRYPHVHRVLENDARLAPHEVHFFKALKQQDYHLAYAGKNHLLPTEQLAANFRHCDIDDDTAMQPGPERQAYRELERRSMARLQEIGSYASGLFHDFPDEVTTTGMIGAQARRYLDEAPLDQSWCLTASFSDPHVPHLAPCRFAEHYPLDQVPLPDWSPTYLQGKPPRLAVKRGAQNAAAATEHDQRHYLAVYGAMCSFVDEQIGHLLDTLRRRTDADRTVVVFVSDHGDFCWHQGLCKKDLLLYDDLLHVPALIHWPTRIRPQVVDRTLTEHVDIVPTLLDYAGIPIPVGCQGRSLMPLLAGDVAGHRDEIHAEICHPHMRSNFRTFDEFRAAWEKNGGAKFAASKPIYNVPGDYTKCLRTDRWKYIWFGDGFQELYDLQADPEETTNLAGMADRAPIVAELRLRLMQWVVLTADPRSPRTEAEQLAAYDRWNYPAQV